MASRWTIMGVTALLVLGCGKSQLDDKPTATVEAPVTAEAPRADEAKPAPEPADKTKAPAPAEKPGAVAPKGAPPVAPGAKPDPLEKANRELVLDARRSSVGFVGRKVTGDHEGTFADFEASATLEGYVPTSLKVSVQTGSVVSDHPKLTNHLKNADFFHASKYPTARFVSTRVRPGAEGVATHTITGELSLLAVTKRITFPATIVVTDAGATGLAEFKINRKDFGIVYPGRPDDLIKDEVLLKLNLAFLDKKYAK